MSALTARVFGLHVSNGGVPKLAVPNVMVTREGIVGDRQRNLKYHGGPDRAVCLYAYELVQRLASEGHAVAPGVLGENVLLAGAPWGELTPGARLVFARGVELEITSYAAPCKQLTHAFSDGVFSRISHKTNPGTSRLYARVLVEGEITTDDEVIIHRTSAISE